MFSKMLIGFTKHDKVWLTRITVLVTIISILVLFYGYSTNYEYWEDIYNPNERQNMEERKVFKRFLEPEYLDHTFPKNRADIMMNKFKDIEGGLYKSWPSNIIIQEEPHLLGQYVFQGKSTRDEANLNAQEALSNWFKWISDPTLDIDGKPLYITPNLLRMNYIFRPSIGLKPFLKEIFL